MPYALVIQKWLIKFWKFYIHNICRSLITLVQKKYIEMEYRFSLNSYWCYVPCAAYRQTRSTRPFHFSFLLCRSVPFPVSPLCKTCGEHRPVCRISRISLSLPYLQRHTFCRFCPSTLLIGAFGFQLVVDVLFIIAIEKTALETGKDIGGMVAVDNAVLSVRGLSSEISRWRIRPSSRFMPVIPSIGYSFCA